MVHWVGLQCILWHLLPIITHILIKKIYADVITNVPGQTDNSKPKTERNTTCVAYPLYSDHISK